MMFKTSCSFYILLSIFILFSAGCTKKPSFDKKSTQNETSLSQTQELLDPTFAIEEIYSSINYSIPDNDVNGVSFDFEVFDDVSIFKLAAEVRIDHTYIGDLEVSLYSPNGTQVILHDRTGGSTDNLYRTYGVQGINIPDLSDFTGESSLGTWTLLVRDLAGGDFGVLRYVRLAIIEEPYNLPNPYNFLAQGTLTNSIDLSWSSGGGDTDGFYVAYQLGTTPPADCYGDFGEDIGYFSTHELLDLSLNTTYALRLCAYDAYGGVSTGVTAVATTGNVIFSPEPVNFLAQALSSDAIHLSWFSGGGSTNGYKLAYRIGATPPVDCNSNQTVNLGNVTQYNLTGLQDDTLYAFLLCSYEVNGYLSEGVVAYEYTEPILPPPNPINFLSEASSFSSIHISWQSGGGTTNGYVVAINQGFTPPATCNSGTVLNSSYNSYDFGGLSAQTSYSFRLCARNSNGDLSNGLTGIQTTLPLPPPDPSGLNAISLNPSSINLSWLSNGGNTTGFIIAYLAGLSAPSDCNTGNVISAAQIGFNTQYSISSLNWGSTYSFRVCSVGLGVNPYISNGVVTTATTRQIPPANPSGLSLISTYDSIAVNWNSGGGSTDRFLVSLVQGAVAPANCSAGSIYITNSNSLTISGLNELTQYSLRVCAQNANTPRETSIGIAGTVTTKEAPPGNPTSLTGIGVSPSQINLSWVSAGGRTARFLVAGAQGNVAPSTCLTGVDVGLATNYSVTSLIAGSAYSFRVCAQSVNIITSSGVVVTAATKQTPPPNPTNLILTSATTSTLNFSWQSGGGFSEHYIVAMVPGTTAPANCTVGTTFPTDSTTFQLSGLSDLANYSIRVCAQNSNFPRDTSSGIILTSQTLELPPPNPTSMAAAGVTSSAININWTSGGGRTGSFLLSLRQGNIPPVDCNGALDVGNVATFQAQGLLPTTSYSFRVCAKSFNGLLSSGVTATGTTFDLTTANLPYADAFDVSNNPDIGSNWWDPTHTFKIQSNKVVKNVAVARALLNMGGTEADIKVSMDVNVPLTQGFAVSDAGLLTRFVGGTQFYLGQVISTNGQFFAEISKSVNGTITNLKRVSLTTGTGNLRLESFFDIQRLYFNNELIAYAFDTSLMSAGTVAFQSLYGTGTTFDNFSTARLNSSGVLPNSKYVVVAADMGEKPVVRLFRVSDGAPVYDFYAYSPVFTGGVRVATGDIDGDSVSDIVVAAGPGGGPHVRVISGATGQSLYEFFAYDPSFRGGIYVAVGDIDGDGKADFVTAADAGGGPHVKIYSGATGQVISQYFAYASTFRGGVRVAVGDVNGDGKGDVFVAPGPGGGPHVKVFDSSTTTLIHNFFAYAPTFTGGVYIAAGDVDGDGKADVITGAGAGGGPHVQARKGTDLSNIVSFFAYGATFTGGARVASSDIDGDGKAEIFTVAGAGGGPHVKGFNGMTGIQLPGQIASFFSFNAGMNKGQFIGVSK